MCTWCWSGHNVTQISTRTPPPKFDFILSWCWNLACHFVARKTVTQTALWHVAKHRSVSHWLRCTRRTRLKWGLALWRHNIYVIAMYHTKCSPHRNTWGMTNAVHVRSLIWQGQCRNDPPPIAKLKGRNCLRLFNASTAWPSRAKADIFAGKAPRESWLHVHVHVPFFAVQGVQPRF